MNPNIIILVLGCLGVGGSLMPIVESGMFNVGVSDLAGAAKLLHVVPTLLIVVALLAASDRLERPHQWYIAIGTTGVVLCLVVASGALQYLEQFEAQFGALNTRLHALAPQPAGNASKGLGSGGWLLMASFSGSVLIGLYGVLNRAPNLEGEQT